MNTQLFCMRGSGGTSGPRLYEDCGLENIWLVDGFSIVHRDGEEMIEPEDVEGLHKAIAQHLACHRKNLTGRDIRFIRRAIDLTQGELAHQLGTTSQTVARWEKNQVGIPGPENRLLRFVTLLAVADRAGFAELVQSMPKNLEELDEGPDRPVRFTHNRFWVEAELEAA